MCQWEPAEVFDYKIHKSSDVCCKCQNLCRIPIIPLRDDQCKASFTRIMYGLQKWLILQNRFNNQYKSKKITRVNWMQHYRWHEPHCVKISHKLSDDDHPLKGSVITFSLLLYSYSFLMPPFIGLILLFLNIKEFQTCSVDTFVWVRRWREGCSLNSKLFISSKARTCSANFIENVPFRF